MQKIKSLFKQKSKSNVADAGDDIAEVEIRTPSKSSSSSSASSTAVNTTTRNIKLEEVPMELIVLIAQFMDLKQLNEFSLCNSRMFQTFFNIRKNDIGKEKNYETDEKSQDFDRVQVLIWKSLALSYFPKVEKSLNVKNWKEFIRKRFKHIKINGNNEKDEEFIENCEWVYKCPLSFYSLSGNDPNVRFCNVCEKHVYLVDSIETFRNRVRCGNCVAYTSKAFQIDDEPLMGKCVENYEIKIRNLY